jgi:hypothetical protein
VIRSLENGAGILFREWLGLAKPQDRADAVLVVLEPEQSPTHIPNLQLVDTFFPVLHESPFSDGVPRVAGRSPERGLLPYDFICSISYCDEKT